MGIKFTQEEFENKLHEKYPSVKITYEEVKQYYEYLKEKKGNERN